MSGFGSSERESNDVEEHHSRPDRLHNSAAYQAAEVRDQSYDDDGPYDPAEHSPMYDVDMEDRTAVFDLALEDDSDDGGGLLDWSILAGKQKHKCCGCDWSWLPCCNCAPPGWWLSLSQRQRLALQGCFAACFVLVLFVVIVAVVFMVYR